MPRPKKRRSICRLPEYTEFGPLQRQTEGLVALQMTVDEYETLRLIDLEDMTQEQCALQMNIARTTVQEIYHRARKKMAEALVQGRSIVIQGGEYRLCEDLSHESCQASCRRQRQRGHT